MSKTVYTFYQLNEEEKQKLLKKYGKKYEPNIVKPENKDGRKEQKTR